MTFQKVLFRPQPYPDNYTDKEVFLSSLKRNTNTHVYGLVECMNQAQLPLQQLSCTVAFVLLNILEFDLSDFHLCVIVLVTMLGYLSIVGFSTREFRTVILFGGFLFGLAPIIQTLTRTISDDTIYVMAAMCLVINFCLHDYTLENKADHMSRCVSLNAAIFAAVCLASRLNNIKHVLGTITLAIFIYGILPSLRRKIGNSSILMGAWTSVQFLIAVGLSYQHQPLVILSLVGCAVVCVIIIPAIFVELQKHKDNIYGPWDEAVLVDIGCSRDLTAE